MKNCGNVSVNPGAWKTIFDEGKILEGGRTGQCSPFSFRCSAVLELVPWHWPPCHPYVRVGGIHPRRGAVDEPRYNPVSPLCCLFGHKPWKRLQPEGIVSQKCYLFVFIQKGRASGNGCVMAVHCTSAFGVAARILALSNWVGGVLWCMLLAARVP